MIEITSIVANQYFKANSLRTMEISNYKQCHIIPKGCPLICHKLPFVWINSPIDIPFVKKNIPFICLNSFGFTLVELIITITIVGIMSALAAPALTTFIANQRLSSQANDLVSDLAFSRSEAIKRASGVTLCKTTDPNAASPACDTTAGATWTAGRVIFIDSNANGTRDAGDEVLRIRQVLDGPAPNANQLIADGSATGTGNRITYIGSGATNLTAGTEYQMTLCDRRGNSQGIAVVIHPLGRTRVTARGKNMSGSAITVCP